MSGKLKFCTQYDILVWSDLCIPYSNLVFLFWLFIVLCTNFEHKRKQLIQFFFQEKQNVIAFVVCVVYFVHLRDVQAYRHKCPLCLSGACYCFCIPAPPCFDWWSDIRRQVLIHGFLSMTWSFALIWLTNNLNLLTLCRSNTNGFWSGQCVVLMR